MRRIPTPAASSHNQDGIPVEGKSELKEKPGAATRGAGEIEPAGNVEVVG
jgi:hypothetical protein